MNTRELQKILGISGKVSAIELKKAHDSKIEEINKAYYMLLSQFQEEEKVTGNSVKELHIDPHCTTTTPLDKLITILPNNNVIMMTTRHWYKKTEIYKIDVDKEPPKKPLLTVDSAVYCIANCQNNNFIIGTSHGRILQISPEGVILLNIESPNHKRIDNLILLPDEQSLIYQSDNNLFLWENFASNILPIHVKGKEFSLLKTHNKSCFISASKEGIEVRDLLTLEVLNKCDIPDTLSYGRMNFYFIEPAPGSPDEFYIAYQHIDHDKYYHPIIARGNINTLSRDGLTQVAELSSLNKGKKMGERFGIYVNESLRLLPDDYIIARNFDKMSLLNIEDPESIKLIPSSIKKSASLAVMRDGRIAEFVADNSGSYQCFTFKSIQDYFLKLSFLESQILPDFMPKDLCKIVTGYLKSHDTDYYKDKLINNSIPKLR